jgi:hypothetical protein
MNDRQKNERYSGVRDQEIRAALDQHWAASDVNDFETEQRIYRENCHSIRCARTPHTDGDETTSPSVTPDIPHTRRHLVWKRD